MQNANFFDGAGTGIWSAAKKLVGGLFIGILGAVALKLAVMGFAALGAAIGLPLLGTAAAVLAVGVVAIVVGYGLWQYGRTAYEFFSGTNLQTGRPLTPEEKWEKGTEVFVGLPLVLWGLKSLPKYLVSLWAARLAPVAPSVPPLGQSESGGATTEGSGAAPDTPGKTPEGASGVEGTQAGQPETSTGPGESATTEPAPVENPGGAPTNDQSPEVMETVPGTKLKGEPYTDFLIDGGEGEGFAARLEGDTPSLDWQGGTGNLKSRLQLLADLADGDPIDTIKGYASASLLDIIEGRVPGRTLDTTRWSRGLEQAFGGTWTTELKYEGEKWWIISKRTPGT